jgi:hypothetical protein
MEDNGYPPRLVKHHIKTYFRSSYDPSRSLHYKDIPFSLPSDAAICDYTRRVNAIAEELRRSVTIEFCDATMIILLAPHIALVSHVF